MFAARLALIGALALGSGTVLAINDRSGPPAPPTARSAPSQYQNLISARTPSQAIDAYAKGLATHGKSPELYSVFLRKMVDLHAPQLAEAQAKALLELQQDNSLALAVEAYDLAQSNQMDKAFADIREAVQNNPDEPFAQDVAGQLVAWYSVNSDKPEITAAMRQTVDELRTKLADKEVYRNSLAQASKALQNMNGKAEAGAPPTYSTPPATNNYYYYPQYPPDTYSGYYDSYPYAYYYDTYPFFGFSAPFFFPRHFHDRDDFFFRDRGRFRGDSGVRGFIGHGDRSRAFPPSGTSRFGVGGDRTRTFTVPGTSRFGGGTVFSTNPSFHGSMTGRGSMGGAHTFVAPGAGGGGTHWFTAPSSGMSGSRTFAAPRVGGSFHSGGGGSSFHGGGGSSFHSGGGFRGGARR